MNPFREFGHFIAYFVPGVLLFVQFLLLASLVAAKNLMMVDLAPINFFVLLIGSTILGVLLDEARHQCLEGTLERSWARTKNVDLNKLCDFASYAPKMTPEVYRLIRDEGFYVYEFDINISVALWVSAIISPIYLDHFHILVHVPRCGLVAVLLVMGVLFFLFGIGAYRYFLNSFVATMETVEPGFTLSISKAALSTSR